MMFHFEVRKEELGDVLLCVCLTVLREMSRYMEGYKGLHYLCCDNDRNVMIIPKNSVHITYLVIIINLFRNVQSGQ